MKNTATETRESSPLCPECGSEKVGFSDTNELKCQCGHLFEPPEHMRGKGTPRSRQRIEHLPSRFKEDRVYWWVNDLIVKATAFGGYFPKSYQEWQVRHPSGSLKQWIESQVDKRMSWEQIQEDLSLYKHSAEPWIVFKIVTSLRHIDENILKGPDLQAVAPYIRRRSAESLALAYAELLPAWRRVPKREDYGEQMTYREAGEILNIKSESVREYARPRRRWLEKHETLPLVSTKSVFDYKEGKKWREI